MKIAVIGNPKIKNIQDVINNIISVLNKSGLECNNVNLDKLESGYDFVCAIGGDGTILKTSRFYAKFSTPVMGINVGRLGFLSSITPEEIEQLGEIISKRQYVTEDRTMLKSGKFQALNDIVVKGHSNIRSSKFNLYINEKLICKYVADGIIVSTPTGSTAYGLSAGGPIIHPSLETMLIVPICAHTMTARPLVVPITEKITIKSEDELLDASSDRQERITAEKEIVIEQADYKAKLVFPNGDNNFYSILKTKLYWGVSPVSEN